MKDSGGNNKKNALSYKTLALVLIAVLSVVFFAFGGWNKVQSAIVDLQKRFADNEQIDGKERTDNGDGTYKLSLSVTGGKTQPQLTAKANVLVIYDVSGSMSHDAYQYTAVGNNDTGSERYGLVNGNYVQLERHWQSQGWGGYYYYTYNGTRYTGTRYRQLSDGERGLKAEKVVYDFASALSTYNDITAGTVNMAMITFSSNNHGSGYGTENNATWLVNGSTNATAWTTNINNITSHLSSNGTSRPRTGALTYGGGTNWEAAMQRGKSVVNALADDRKNEPTYVIFVTDGAPTFRVTEKSTTWHDGNNSGTTTHGRGRSSDDDITNYYYAADDAKAIQDIGNNVNFYGIYAYGDEGDLLDDLVNYAYTGIDRTNYGKTNQQAQATWSLTNSVEHYYNASDTTALQGAISDIFDDIVETLGVGEVTINDGTTSNVETTSGEISQLLNVDSSSFEYSMTFPVSAVSGEEDTYTITRKNKLGQNYDIVLAKNEDGSYQASWGTNSVKLEGTINLGKFIYKWTEANDFYDVAPPAASYNTETGQVEWKLPRETVGTLLDDVKYTVYFDVYPSQYTYDTVARIKNATDPQAEYDKLDANEKKYLKYENGEVTLETNKEATLTYTDNRNGNTTPTTKTYKNPPRVVTDSSKLDVEKVWLNKEDKKFVPDNLSVKMELVRDNVDTGIELTLNKNGDWTDDVAIATGLMRTKVVDKKTVVEVLDSGHDYTLKETSIEGNIKDYQWELELETVHPMIINGQLTTLIEVPTNEIPSGMASTDEVYTNNDHTFYRFNGKVYYDKVVPTTGQDQTNAKLNAYNIRKSNFNFTKKVEGDPVGGEFFNFTFKVNDANIDETNIPADATEKELADKYSVWFSVCDSNKLAAMGKSCEDSDAWQYYEKDLTTSATPEEGDTGYYYAPDNTNITLSIQDGWNVRVTNIGTGSTYNITEAAPTSPFELTNIDGNVLVSVPELPANAIETSDGVYNVNGVEYRRVTETDAAGVERTVYQYTYEPETNVQNGTISGTIVAPNNTYAVTYVNNYPKTHLTVTKDWHVADSAKKPVNVTLYRSVNGGAKQKVTQTGLSNPVTLNASNNWTYNFKDLDLYDANENVYDYFVEEDELDGNYTTTYSGKEDIVVSATDIPENVDEVRAVVSITGQQASSNESIEVILNKDNNWKYTVANKDYLNEDGTVKTVTVSSNSTATIHYALTNRSNTIVNEEFTTVEGQKTWDDAENQDDVRPESITINLLADGVQKDTKVVKSSDNNWSWSWENLPKYKATTVDGKTTYVEIVYTVTEAAVQYYDGAITENTDYSFTNTHTPFESTVTVAKEWHDENNRDGIRPTSISVILQDSTGLILTDENHNNVITLTAADNWTKTITVQRKSAGEDVTYTVKEVGVVTTDYTATISNPKYEEETTTNQDRVITLNLDNSHTPETVELSGEKTWDDADNQDGLRPESITVTLYADGSPVEGKTITVTPDKDNHWTYNFGSLPKYKAGAVGVQIEYTVREASITGYTASYNDGTNLNISNKHEPETTSFEGEKTWADANDQDGLRPESITVQLLADGSPVEGKTVTISPDENGNWPKYSFDNLPKYKNTTLSSDTAYEINYTVTDNVGGYVASNNSKNLTNTHKPETITVNGTKTWADADDQDGLRPDSITIQLLADGSPVTGKVAEVTEAEDGSWTWSFAGLPKYRDHGTEIVYTVSESGVDTNDYTITVNGMNVTNTHEPEKITVSGTKTWSDADNQDGIRPERITVKLLADGIDTGKTEIASAPNWTYNFGQLDKYKDGTEIVYTVEEVPVANYTPNSTGYNIENTHTPFESTLLITKEWHDNNNQDGKRPETINVIIKDSTGLILTDEKGNNIITLTEANGWSTTVNVQRRLAGQDVTYEVQEVGVVTTDYTAVIANPEASTTEGTNSNQTITLHIDNNHTLETVDVEGSKTWNDADDQDGKRPESIIIKLFADGVLKDTKTVTAADNWSWSWTGLTKYKAGEEGEEIVYTIEETQVPEYQAPVVDGYNVTNTHEPEKTSVSGTKTWDDANNQDGVRPASVTVNLLANGTKVDSKTVTAADGWKYSFTDLDKYSGGTEISYTVTEDAVDGYTPTITGYNITNTHKPEKTSVSGVKNWVDSDNQDGKRPASITVNLLANGTKVDSKTVTAKDEWKYSFTDLDKFAGGTEISYTITEDAVADYETTYSGNDITNTHTPGKTVVSGTKTWDDNGNQDGKRPTSITIKLLANGTVVDSKQVTAQDNWTWTFSNLDEYANGSAIVYTIEEDQVADYEEPVVNGYNVTNTHKIEKTSVTGEKTWDDADNQDGLRPASVTINLLANGVEVDEQVVSAATNWKYSFTDLDKYVGGEEITYTVVEDEVTGYTPVLVETGIKNVHKPEKTKVEGTKHWEDSDNQDNVRPSSIEITLKADGQVVETKTVTAADNWSWSWTELDKYRDHGTEIIYTVEEGKVDYYEATNTPNTEFDITNTHNAFKTSLTVVKSWDDNDNQDGKRPEKVTFSLMQDGVKIYENIELSAANNWTYTNNDLPRRAAGKDIVYSVVEVDVNREDYTPSDNTRPTLTTEQNGEQTTTITVTNTHKPETVNVEGSKTWTDENNQDGKRPESITVNLLADNAVIDSKTVKASDNWSWSWTELPKYEVGKVGHEITYSVSEEAVAGYRTVVSGYDIENIHDIDTTSITGTKIWDDANDQDGLRPASVIITLYADGEAIDTQTANVANNWSYSFTDLPVNKAGSVKTPIAYTVGEAEEDIPEGYTSSVSGNNVTNKHTPEVIDISGTKVWADSNNQDGLRPASITVNLFADGTQVDSQTVTGGSTADSWNYSFTGKPKYRDQRTEIVYTVTESGVNTVDYTTTINGTTITNTHKPSEVSVPVSKTWVDTDNKEGLRPTSVSVSLLADGKEVRTATLSKDNDWSWNWTGLPEKRDEGTTIVYTVRENNVDSNYEATYPTATTIVNTIKNLSKNIPVAKIWDDENNRDNARPTTITYTLTGTVPGKEKPVVERELDLTINDVDANDPNKWTSVFENVPIFDEGTWITYTVNEKEVAGYTPVSNETVDGVVTITNNHELTTIDLTATKAWDDNEDNDGKRPEKVLITLYADGVEQETKEATAATNWQVKFEGLVKYAEGKVGTEIVYTVAEKEENIPEGYTPSVTGNTITNTHEALKITYKVTKDWQDFDNNDGVRPDHITVRLVGKVGDTVVTTKEMDVYEINEGFENEPWTYAFTDLPKYYNKELVQYTLTEDNVDLYETKEIEVIENKEDTTTIENTITNEHSKIPYNETGTITVNKYWYDENDKYKKRPGSITVNLLADGEIYQTAELTAENSWTFTFENLPMYTIRDGEVGCEIVYSIQEVAVENYKTTIDGFDITNTYNGPVPEITPPNTGVAMTKRTDNNVLFEMILTMLATSYTVVVLRKANEQ